MAIHSAGSQGFRSCGQPTALTEHADCRWSTCQE